jgi:hypothetical protein
MALKLHTVSPRQGLAWIVSGWRVFLMRPLSFVALFAIFMATVVLLSWMPIVGSVLGLAIVPLLTVAYMVATRRAMAGETFRATVLIAALRSEGHASRWPMLRLCGVYAIISLLIVVFTHWLDGGALSRAQELLVGGNPKPGELVIALSDPRLFWGLLVFAVLVSLVAVPFWYAPALILWGGQGATQSLFSSTLAVWRNRAAFSVYIGAWTALAFGFVLLTAVLMIAAAAAGLERLAGFLPMTGILGLTAWFYVSLWFCFADAFGDVDLAAIDESVPI